MEKSNISEIEFQLNKLILRYSGLFVYHQWPSEHKRWIELIFALLTRITKKSEDRIRATIEELDALNLLGIEALAETSGTGDGINLDHPHARRIVECLFESGFTEEESKSGILVMQEAAIGLKENHGGKIQEYLRIYGQRMIDELSQNFSFSKMNEEEIKYSFTYWLQNVLNMPVILRTDNVEKFCKRLQITYEELLKAADNLDINLALLDDMIDQYIRDSEKSQ